jgi:Eukaryotic aspartyl protease
MGVRTSAVPPALSLLQATHSCGLVPSRLVLLARNLLVGHYFEVVQSSKLITCAVDFDTVTADLLLFGPSCPSCQGHNIYDPSNSSTADDLKTPFNLSTSLGNNAGDVFTDSLNIGGLEVSAYWSGILTDN